MTMQFRYLAAASSRGRQIIRRAAAGELPITASLAGRWRASQGWADEVGSNALASEGGTISTITTPAGSVASSIPVGARLAGGASGLPTSAAARTVYFVAAYKPGADSLAAGFAYGSPSAGQAFGATRRGRELALLQWGANDQFSEWAMIDGHWVVQSVKIDALGNWSHKINGIQIDNGTGLAPSTVLTRTVIGGTLASTVSTHNTTPVDAAEALIYSAHHTDQEEQDIIDYLTTQHIAGQTAAAIAAAGGEWLLDVGTETYRPAPHFTGGAGAYSLAIQSQTLAPAATLANLVLTGDPTTSSGNVVVRATDTLGGFADLTLTVQAGSEAPIAYDDSASVTEGSSFSVNVIANDVVGDESTLTVTAFTIISGGAHVTGTAISADGTSITGTANLVAASEPVSIEYTIQNQTGLTDTGTLILTVVDSTATPPAQMVAGDWSITNAPDETGDKLRVQIINAPASSEPIDDYVLFDGTTEYPLGSTALATNIDKGGFTPDKTYAMQIFARSVVGDGTASANTINVAPTHWTTITATAVEGVYEFTGPAANLTFTVSGGTLHDGAHVVPGADLLTGPSPVAEPIIEDDNNDKVANLTIRGIWATNDTFGTFATSADWYEGEVAQGTNGGPSYDYSAAPGSTDITYRETGSDTGSVDRVSKSNAITTAADAMSATGSNNTITGTSEVGVTNGSTTGSNNTIQGV